MTEVKLSARVFLKTNIDDNKLCDIVLCLNKQMALVTITIALSYQQRQPGVVYHSLRPIQVQRLIPLDFCTALTHSKEINILLMTLLNLQRHIFL